MEKEQRRVSVQYSVYSGVVTCWAVRIATAALFPKPAFLLLLLFGTGESKLHWLRGASTWRLGEGVKKLHLLLHVDVARK